MSRPVRSVAVISNGAFALGNFRGPMMHAMVERGVRVYALAPDYDEATRAAVMATGAEPVDFALDRTGLHPVRDFVSLLRLAMLLRRLRPDATFAFFVKPVIYGSIAAWLARVPRRVAMVAGLGHAFAPDGGRRTLRWIVTTLYRIAFAVCDAVLLQNEDDRADLLAARAVDPRKIVMIAGTGVDLDKLRPAPPVTEPPTFVLAARLLREKGIGEFAAAARILRAEFPQAHFIVAGGLDPNPDGIPVSEMDGWASEGAIEWLGHVADMPALLAQVTAYVLPSYYREGKPRSTQEAMALARPIVTTDSPGCRDTVVEGVNGFLVPVRDVDALAAAMRRFIVDPGLVAPMGEASRRLAEERFDVHRINTTILAAIGINDQAARS